MNKPLTGQAYWELIERTARHVETWPDWKRGERTISAECRAMACADCETVTCRHFCHVVSPEGATHD